MFSFFYLFFYDLIQAENKFYPVVDYKKLERELKALYMGTKLRKRGFVKTLLYLKNNNLTKSLTETIKLSASLLTVPMFN